MTTISYWGRDAMTDQPNDSNKKNHEVVLKIVLFVAIAIPMLAVVFVSDFSGPELLPALS